MLEHAVEVPVARESGCVGNLLQREALARAVELDGTLEALLVSVVEHADADLLAEESRQARLREAGVARDFADRLDARIVADHGGRALNGRMGRRP
ncbi:MAG TPA: hypothetical protein VIP52_14130 [Candidatus Dormibacteraeota bacterium]